MKTLLTFLVSLLIMGSANADPGVRKALETRFPELKAERITKTQYAGLFEIFSGGEIFYTDEKATFVVLGNIVDTKSRENVTEARLRKLTVVPFSELPLELAVKTVVGTGARKIAVFSDPYCGFCKRFEPDLLALKDVTIYTFLYPIIRAESTPISKRVWCSGDRVKAWQDLMLRNVEPGPEAGCDNPIDKTLALGRKLRVNGTPLTIFEDGERISGAVPRDTLEKKLASLGDAKK